MSNGDDIQKLTDELKARIELLKTETELLTKQRELAKLSDPTALATEQAKATKELATATVDMYKAFLPATQALTGSLAISDKVVMESQILGYRMLDEQAGQIAKEIAAKVGKDAKSVVLVAASDKDIDSLLTYQHFSGLVTKLQGEYDALRPAGKKDVVDLLALPPIAVGAALSAAFDALALLRENVDIKATEFAIPDTAVVASIAARLEQKFKITTPNLVPPGLLKHESGLLKSIGDLGTKRQEAHSAIGTLPESEDKKRRQAELAKLDEAYASVMGALGKFDEKTGSGLLSLLLRGEKLKEATSADAHFLYVKAYAAGGSNRATQSLLPWRTRPAYNGAVIVGCFVISQNGEVVHAGVYRGYSGYRHEVDRPLDEKVYGLWSAIKALGRWVTS